MSSKSKASSKKRGGRTTAKGTQPTPKKAARNVVDTTPDPFEDRTVGKVGRSKGRPARPITHHRGNR